MSNYIMILKIDFHSFLFIPPFFTLAPWDQFPKEPTCTQAFVSFRLLREPRLKHSPVPPSSFLTFWKLSPKIQSAYVHRKFGVPAKGNVGVYGLLLGSCDSNK